MNIEIKSPCQEDWNQMTTESGGKYCNSCAKTVVDFTNFTDAELQQYFLSFTKKSESVCGRFTTDQAVAQKPEVTRNKFLLWCWFIATTILLFFSKQSKAQQIVGEIAAPIEQTADKKVKKVSVYDMAISIMVKDALGNAISDAMIYLDDKLIETRTGKDGGAAILVSKDTKTITIKKSNLDTKVIVLNNATHYKITVSESKEERPMIMGKISVRPPSFQGAIEIDQ